MYVCMYVHLQKSDEIQTFSSPHGTFRVTGMIWIDGLMNHKKILSLENKGCSSVDEQYVFCVCISQSFSHRVTLSTCHGQIKSNRYC